MDTPPTPSVSRFSLRNVLVVVVPAALLALGYYWYLTHQAEQGFPQENLHHFLRLHLKAPTKLDEGLVDEDGDLVAATPKNSKDQIDPDTLVFSVLGDDLDKEKATFADFTTHLAKATGKKVQLIVWADTSEEQMSELRAGKLHIAAFNTGSVSTAVNNGGFVPFCVMADDNGKFGYEMQIIVPADSAPQKPADLKGTAISFASPYSHSGFKAPIVILWKEFNLQPGRDYHPSNAGTSKMVAKGVANGKLEAGAVASDLLKRMIFSGEVDGKAIRSIYSSKSTFPTACFGHAHQLKPDLAGKIKAAFFEFNFKGTSLEKDYVAAGQTKFVPISYKTDWAAVRAMDEQATQFVESELALSRK